MIIVNNLCKKFGNLVAVDNLCLTVNRGEVLGFLGANGAGKTTTMKMLSTFLLPDSGAVTVNGFDVVRQSLSVRETLGYLAENSPLYEEMTVLAFLQFICGVRKIYGKTAINAIDKVINDCALYDRLPQMIGTLSKGYRRRVGLAQALIHNPPTLILDEPTDGLDPQQSYEVRKLIKKIATEKCIIISTHILDEVSAICDRVIIIGDGKKLCDATPQTLQQQYNEMSLNEIFRKLTTK